MIPAASLKQYFSEAGLVCHGSPSTSLAGWCLVENPDDAVAGTLAVMTGCYEDHQWEVCHRHCMELLARKALPLVRGPGPADALSLEGNPSLKTITALCQKLFHNVEADVLALLGRQASLQEVIDLLGPSLGNVAWIEMPHRHTLLASRSSQFIGQIKTLALHELLGIYNHRIVKLDDRDAGYLLAYPPEGTDGEALMNQGALALTILLERRTGRSDDALRRKESLLQRLLFCDADEESSLKAQARKEWPEGEKAVVIVEHRRFGGDEGAVKKQLDRLCPGTLRLRTGHQTLLLCRREQWELLGNRLTDDLFHSGWRAASGAFDSDAARLKESYAEAKRTLGFADHLSQPRWLCWEQCDVQALLQPLADSDEARQFIARRLGPVARDKELIHTLEALEQSGWHQARAAKELSVHYNTLRQRLSKISTLAPELLEAPHRPALSLALLLRSLQKL